MAEAVFHHVHQPGMLAQIGIETLHLPEFGHPAGRVDGVDQVPGGEVEIHLAGHFAPGRADAPVTAGRKDVRQLDVAVEVGAGHMHAVVGQDVGASVHALALLRADAHQREVGGAAADVGHQHDLLAVDGGLEIQRSGDRLELEADVGETHGARRLFQGGLGGAVARGVVVDEEHRSAQHHMGQRAAGIALGQRLEATQVGTDHVQIPHGAAAADIGRLVGQRGAQDAFHGAHQPALGALHIRGDRGTAEGQLRLLVGGQALHRIEHGGGHGGLAVLQVHQVHLLARARQGDGRVGGAEINGADSGHGKGGGWGRPQECGGWTTERARF